MTVGKYNFPVKKFEFFETTADTGMILWGGSPADLFTNAVKALNKLIFGDISLAREGERLCLPCRVRGHDRESLMVNLLTEVLCLQEIRDLEVMELKTFRVHKNLIQGEWIARKPARMPIVVVKSITYHHLRVKRTLRGWNARVVVDL